MSTLIQPPLASFPSGFPVSDAYPVIPTDGLMAWYEFDEGSGTALLDKSGNDNDAVLSGSPVWDAEGLTFDGVDDYATTEVVGTAEFTWVVLIKPVSGGPVNQRIMGDAKTVASFATGAIAWLLDGTDAFRTVSARDTGVNITSTITGPAVADVWHIVSFSRYGSGADARQQVRTKDTFDNDSMVSGTGTAADPILLGDTFQQAPTQRFKGKFAGALLYNRGLTPDERIEVVRYLNILAAQRSITVT